MSAMGPRTDLNQEYQLISNMYAIRSFLKLGLKILNGGLTYFADPQVLMTDSNRQGAGVQHPKQRRVYASDCLYLFGDLLVKNPKFIPIFFAFSISLTKTSKVVGIHTLENSTLDIRIY